MAFAERTEVPFQRSIRQIIDLVRKHGAEQIGQMDCGDIFAISFMIENRRLLFRVPLVDSESRFSSEQVRRQRGRALLLVIKGKLESVETGLETIEQAFLANVVMSDGRTVYERVAEPMAIEYQTGRPSATSGLLPPPASAAP